MRRFAANRYGGMFVVAMLVLALSACFGGSRSIEPDYYLLTSTLQSGSPLTGTQSPPAATRPAATFSIGVGPVRVAPFLARQQIVTHGGTGTMDIQHGRRWGEPLEQGIQRVLLQNLAALTGAQTRLFPWRQNTTPDYALRIDVSDLDKLAGNTALLEVSWTLEDLKARKLLATQQARLTTTINSTTVDSTTINNTTVNDASALADAYSELLGQLARQVQQEIPTSSMMRQ